MKTRDNDGPGAGIATRSQACIIFERTKERTMRFVILGLWIGVTLAISGCGDSGPALAPVKGKVTLYGKPYTKGLVTFEPQGGGPVGSSQTDADGNYEIWTAGKKGAMIANHKIIVTTIMEAPAVETPAAPTSSDDPAYMAQSAGMNMSAYKEAKAQKEPIPAKYNKSSELTLDVKSGTNEFNIDMR